ncbi:MAG: ATP-dependent helicase [Eubacterium aggregans]|uniref:ATP-dependent helicase n=2 Tax=Eubacterium aggregans TaxID=81409 RepID=UPI002B1FDA69|nr:ATP-dependent helicase [Eubacterium aggregans]MEA5073159.1 ATP-dependent helicase [Eubacterium aggregans]
MDLTQYLERYAITLNAQQLEAMERIQGATLLLAVPGSGKTTVIICRLGYMIRELGISEDQILTLTFSRAGARDLGQRYRSILGGEGAAPRFSTIHSFALSVIRTYERQTGRRAFDVLQDVGAVIRALFRQVFKSYPSDNDIADILSAITYTKNLMLNEEEIAALKVGDLDFPRIYTAYEQYKRKAHLMDFDDMLRYAWLLLKKYPALLAHFTERYRYINVDEAQDTSKIQFELIHLLVARWGNLFMVGDEDQSIYGFRGAYPQGLLDFETQYPQGKVLLMETNYRSTGALVASANRFITLNQERYPKKMTTPNALGVPAVQEYVKTLEDQYRFLLNSVQKEGKETAVLYRNNESAIPLVDLFERQGVPYRLKEHNPLFFSHFVVRDILDFLALSEDPGDGEIFEKSYYKMNCGISKENMIQAIRQKKPGETVFHALYTLPGIPEWLVERVQTQEAGFQRLKTLPMNRVVDYIEHQLGYGEHLAYRVEMGCREEQLTQKMEILKTLAKREETRDGFRRRLSDLAAILRGETESKGRGVLLSTIHSSKGLEFEKVFIIDAVDGEFPSRAALEPTEEGERLMNEEIRLFYVGVTRAKGELEFISVGQKGRYNPTRPVSRFVEHYLGRRPVAKAAEKPITGGKSPGKRGLSMGTASVRPEVMPKAAVPDHWGVGTIITHGGFGPGEITALEGETATVRFERAGAKKLNLAICLSKGIIE